MSGSTSVLNTRPENADRPAYPAPERFEVTTRTHRITVELDDQYEEPRGFITVAAAVAHSDDYAEYLDLFRADMVADNTAPWWAFEVLRGFPGGVEYKAAVLALTRMALNELHSVNALGREPTGEAVTYFDYAGCDECLCTPGAVVRAHRPLTIRGRNFVFWIDTR